MDLQTIFTQVEQTKAAMLAALAERDAQIAKNGAASEATANLVNETGKTLIALQGEVKAKYDEFLQKLADSGVRMDEIDKKLGRVGVGSGAHAADSKTLADLIVGHEHYKTFRERGEKKSQKIPIKSFFPNSSAAAVKATFGLTSAGGDDLNQALRVEPVAAQTRQLRIRDLMPVRPISVDVVEYLEETAFGADAGAASITSITSSSTTATVTTAAANHGLVDGDLVRIAGATQTEYNGDYYVTVTGANTFTYTFAGSVTSPATGTKTWLKLNSYGAAATVAEGALKPEALLEFALRRANCEVIAHFLPATKQAVMDSAMLSAYINDRLLYGVEFAEEQQILYGSGTGTNLQGILTHPRVQTYFWSDGVVGDTKIDAIRRAVTKAQVREFTPSGVVVNPVDWEDVELAKGDDGHYLWFQVQAGPGITRIFQMPVVVTNAIAPEDYLVGSFAVGAALWDREQAHVEVSTEHDDFFRRNMVGILAEERIALTIFRPDSFVAGAFDAEPSA